VSLSVYISVKQERGKRCRTPPKGFIVDELHLLSLSLIYIYIYIRGGGTSFQGAVLTFACRASYNLTELLNRQSHLQAEILIQDSENAKAC
jgi:hypothetical protein